MGLFSKLFSGNDGSTSTEEDEKASDAQPQAQATAPEAAPPKPTTRMISTPHVMPAYVPPAARPTPVDVFERPTVPTLEPLAPIAAGERPTVVVPEPVIPQAAAKPVAKPAATLPRPRPAAPPVAKPQPPKPPPAPSPKASAVQPKVARPAAPPAKAGDDVETSFATIERKSQRPPRPGTLKTDLTDVRKLFAQLATNHLRQVRDFIIELRWGPTSATWISVCEPSVASLLRAAYTLEFDELSTKLREFTAAMQAQDATAAVIDGAVRERILETHGALEKLLPDTFALDSDKSQREAAILHALLSQIPDVHKVTIDKLYAAGLTTLETMLLAKVDDLVSATGIPELLATRIVDRFRIHREEMKNATIDETRARERSEIRALVDKLRAHNEEFERASAAWTEEARQQKKEILLERTQTMLAIDLQLARLGEIALVRELERMPFARKLLRLETFIAEARKKYAAPATKRA